MRSLRWICVGLLLLCSVPVLSVLLSMAIADLYDCGVNEASVAACETPLGDIGGMLYFGFVMGWMMLITLPAAALIASVWAVIEIVVRIRRP